MVLGKLQRDQNIAACSVCSANSCAYAKSSLTVQLWLPAQHWIVHIMSVGVLYQDHECASMSHYLSQHLTPLVIQFTTQFMELRQLDTTVSIQTEHAM
jgi:hypothetical protein